MAVAVSNLSQNRKFPGKNDTTEQKFFKKLALKAAGKVAVCTAAENGSATTTVASTNLRINGLKAGRTYQVRLHVRATNATVAGGAKIQLNLSGTQTTAVLIGDLWVSSSVAFTTVTATAVTAVVAGITALPSASLAINTDYGIGGTGGGGPVTFILNGVLVPQNDGDLTLQLGSGLGNTQSSLSAGSLLEVQELTF